MSATPAFQDVSIAKPRGASLVKKLAEVMKAVERIPKRGHNDFHHYDYATEADIVAAIRAELATRHVMLIPGITGCTREKVGEKGSVLTHLTMTFTFMDGETGEVLERAWLGAGTDKEDKGAYKAMTGGEKYFLLKTFLIPTGDDPEEDTATHPQAQENRRAHDAKKAAAARQASQATSPEPSADPLDGELPDGRVRIASVKVKKEGTSKAGKPYKIYAVTDDHGEEYGTFSDSLAKVAIRCREQRTPVELRYESDKFGKNLLEILTPREPGEEG